MGAGVGAGGGGGGGTWEVKAAKSMMTHEEVVAVIASSVRRQIESDIFVPLMEKLREKLGEGNAEEEVELKQKMAAAKSNPQTFYGIPGGVSGRGRGAVSISLCTTGPLSHKPPPLPSNRPVHQISPSSWESATYHLSNIDAYVPRHHHRVHRTDHEPRITANSALTRFLTPRHVPPPLR